MARDVSGIKRDNPLVCHAKYKSTRIRKRVLDAVKVTESYITSLKSIEVVGHEAAITYNLWLLSKMNERSILRTSLL